MSPDGRLFVSVGDDAKAIVWDARTFAPVETLTGHGGRITGAVFSRDSRTLFTSSLDGTVLEWDVGNTRRFGRSFRYLPGPLAYDPAAPATPALAVAPTGNALPSTV
jgi:WD40 repeat protein